jgi:hypothetical protein
VRGSTTADSWPPVGLALPVKQAATIDLRPFGLECEPAGDTAASFTCYGVLLTSLNENLGIRHLLYAEHKPGEAPFARTAPPDRR